MKKYYKLWLNSGRYSEHWDYTDYGFIKAGPRVEKRDEPFLFGLFNVNVEHICFDCELYIVAEFDVDKNKFIELATNRKIGYDPNGIRSYDSFYNVSTEKLEKDAKLGLNCYKYEEISYTEVAEYLTMIKNYPKAIDKINEELNIISSKQEVKKELARRRKEEIDEKQKEQEALNIINNFEKTRKR